MHLNAIITPASNTNVAVTFQRETPLRLPLTNIRRGLSATPKVAFLRSMLQPNALVPAFLATGLLFGAFRRHELSMADNAPSTLLTATEPTMCAVARLRAKAPTVSTRGASRTVEVFRAFFALASFAVLHPVKRLGLFACVPWDSGDVFLAAFFRTIKSGSVPSGYRRRTAFAWMRFWSHNCAIIQYVEMARKRIKADSPMFAEVA